MFAIFRKQKGKLFDNMVVKEMLNKDATKDNILDGLDWLIRVMNKE